MESTLSTESLESDPSNLSFELESKMIDDGKDPLAPLAKAFKLTLLNVIVYLINNQK